VPAARPVRLPPTAGTASPRPNGNWRRSESSRSPSRAKPRSQPPAAPSSIPAASASSSSGEPAAKAGSATSSADTAGTAPGWTAAKEPPSGAGTGYSATTWSRSAPSPADRPQPDPRTPPVPPPEISLQTFSGRSKLGSHLGDQVADHNGSARVLPDGLTRAMRHERIFLSTTAMHNYASINRLSGRSWDFGTVADERGLLLAVPTRHSGPCNYWSMANGIRPGD
jgi:hypothetical protein